MVIQFYLKCFKS